MLAVGPSETRRRGKQLRGRLVVAKEHSQNRPLALGLLFANLACLG